MSCAAVRVLGPAAGRFRVLIFTTFESVDKVMGGTGRGEREDARAAEAR